MLLFPQKEERASSAEKVFYVFSARQPVSQKLGQQLRLAGFSRVEEVYQDLLTVQGVTFSPNAAGMIVDIGGYEQAEDVITALQALVPRNVWCCAAGDSDSISLAQNFARHGVGYFNLNIQSEELISAAVSGTLVVKPRGAVGISILGCKGGVGTSTIAWNLAQQIVQLRQMPLLLVQGRLGTRDLDLRVKKRIQQEVMPVVKHLDIMIKDSESPPELEQSVFEKYNFVVFEESITSLSKEALRQLIEKTACLVLVIDRSMSSVRTALQAIEITDAMNRTQSVPRRLLLCLSDSRPVTLDVLSPEDLQSLLERPIDVLFPYQKTRSSLFSFLRKRATPGDRLAQRVLGNAMSSSGSLFRRFSGNK